MYFDNISQGKFAVKGQDIKDGDIIKLTDAGSERESTFQGKTRKQWVFEIETTSGEKKLIAMNGKSLNNMVEAYGHDSEEWVGKPVKVWIVRALVADKMVDILYLSHPEAEMDRDGKFILAPESVRVDKLEDIDGDWSWLVNGWDQNA